MNIAEATADSIDVRSQELFAERRQQIFRRTDRLFAGLMTFQWLAGIVVALWISPRTWIGFESQVHVHVWAAVILGGLITSFPVFMAIAHPGKTLTRHSIAAGQMLTSALLIHLFGGRIETHFHVFGSLAFLAFYRDWTVLVTASVVVAADHFLRGVLWPQSVYGVLTASKWRWLEHASWVIFEDIFLIWSCRRSAADMRETTRRQVLLEVAKGKAQQARDAAEAANIAKTEFLANMSHEIRTPLNGILGFAEFLQLNDATISPAERSDYLQTIRTSGRHLLTLINDILDLSKIEVGKLELDRAPCSPHQIISEVVSVMRVRAQEKGLTLEYSWSGGVPKTIETDGLRFRQLLMNIIGNAIKFTERGSVEVRAQLVQRFDERQLALKITDTGIGIPLEKLEAIFEPFVQADNSVTRRFGGTGLGLAISRRLARQMGGELTVRSEMGVGSTFSFTIDPGSLGDAPLHEPAVGEQTTSDLVSAAVEPMALHSVKILLVEDGETNRKLINLVLRRAGAEVVTAENGQLGVEAAANEAFDVVLMDMQMPVMDGYTAARTLRQRGFAGPIIALTAHAMMGDEELCRAAGCCGYLTKPIDSLQLIQYIAAAVHNRGPAPAESHTTFPITSRHTDKEVEPLYSLLPCDDPAIAEIVAEFVTALSHKVATLRGAIERQDFDEVAKVAHSVKGSAGMVGFPLFTTPATELHRAAREKRSADVKRWGRVISGLAERVVAPSLTATVSER